MDNNEIEHFITLTGENFYKHIEEHYGIYVGKILRFHDIDTYLILGQVDKHELLDIFEKPNDENSSTVLVDLKKEICNMYQNKVSLKIGTKNKILVLLNSTKNILKRNKSLLVTQSQLKRIDKRRSTSSINTDSSDNEVIYKDHHSIIERSMEKLLLNIKNYIHGIKYTDLIVKDFKIIFQNMDDQAVPTCSIQCICGDRIKLYSKRNTFQLSNITKHFKLINSKSKSVTNHPDEQISDSATSNIMNQSADFSTNDNNLSITQTTLRTYIYSDNGSLDSPRPVSAEENQKEKSRDQSANDELNDDALVTNEQRPKENLIREFRTQISISVTEPSQTKQQLVNVKQARTTTMSSNNPHTKPSKEQNVNLTNISQSNKRNINENEKQMQSSSSSRSIKKRSQQSVSTAWFYKYVTHVVLRTIQISYKTPSSDILCALINTIDYNKHRPPNNYRYTNSVLRFAVCLFILAGIYVYQYLRINFKYLLPSIQTIKKFYAHNPYAEAKFRYDESKIHLDSVQSKLIFLAEDCSSIIPRIQYDSNLNIFTGFVTPMIDGLPQTDAFNFKSFEEFKLSLETEVRAHLVNVHVIQPIPNGNCSTAPAVSVLTAYGTNNKITSMDILKRWISIFREFHSRNIRILGISTDGDPKYLRAMRVASNFFIKTDSINIFNDRRCFTIKISNNWLSWYFLQPNQLFLFLQDGIHLCTKFRNRLLSKKARLKMGRYEISLKHLYNLIDTTNKIDCNITKSDLNVNDRQNFSSCQRISNEKVLDLLNLNDQWKGTYNYLFMLNLLIKSYTQPQIVLLDRILYSWIVIFYVRLWRIWLYITKRNRVSSVEINTISNEQNYFITSNALTSIEINGHYLVYLYLLIEQNIIPVSTADFVHLFSSQSCAGVFRNSRSLSGTYSTRINFTMKQFLQRINKLNALTELKQFEATDDLEKILFPVHQKLKQYTTQRTSNIHHQQTDFNRSYVETTIIESYKIAQQLAISVGMDIDLIKNNMFNLEQSSPIAKQLLQLNSSTESSILTIDDSDNEESDEEEDIEDIVEEYSGDDEEDFIEESYDNETDIDDHEEDQDGTEEYDNDVQEDVDVQTTSSFENLQASSYSGLRLVKFVSTVNQHKYFSINIHKKKMFLHKATATWYLQDRQCRLPSDRLQRVQRKQNLH